MGTKINHVAIVSDAYAMAQQFYQAVFGFKPPSVQKNFTAATVGDGYVGININPRRPVRPAGLDHFGVEVEDADAFVDKLASKYPECRPLKRPSNRPFAGMTTHDPDGNIFDFSSPRMENRGEIYTESEEGWSQDRIITHYALRTMNPEKLAEFYADVLDLPLANKAEDDPNYYITDGRMTLVLMQWSIEDYAAQGIVRPGPNHIGIKVEDIDALKADVAQAVGANPSLAPDIVAMGPEGEALRALLEKSVPYAKFQMSDNNKVALCIHED
ncbi:MAG: VOC family protein [Alphaproteobacteria bacterium]|nr:VOC family protein [Alphaproteobacteria bacterium]